MVDVTVNTGTTVGLSATLPTTYDDNVTTGYASLTFTGIGEVVDIGEIAKAFAVVAHQTVGRAYPQKLKDTYDIANITLTLGRVSTDAGQIAIQSALSASTSVAFEVALPSGDFAYFTGKVIKAGIGGVASGAVTTTVVEIAIDAETLFEA